MPPLVNRWLLTGALVAAASGTCLGTESQENQSQTEHALAALPIHIVIRNDRLKAQIAYGPAGDMTWMMSPTSGISSGVSPLGAGLGVGLGLAIADGIAYTSATNAVLPPYMVLRRAQCDLPMSDTYTTAVESGIRTTTWAGQSSIQHHSLEQNPQILEKQLTKSGPRYVFLISYSLTPDFSALITTVAAEAFSPELPNAPRRWETNPAQQNVIFVVSNKLTVPDKKSAADIEETVQDEMLRYDEGLIRSLIDKANKGDFDARRQAEALMRDHKSKLKSARKPTWTDTQRAAYLAHRWSNNGCALLKQTAETNAQELEKIVAQALAGQLPSMADDGKKQRLFNAMEPFPGEVTGERRITTFPNNIVVSRRGGDLVPLQFAGSWIEAPSSGKAP